jgi:Tripartite tricarboxylate transporter family receptor
VEAALAALPSMLPADVETRREAFDLVKQILSACGPLSPEDTERLQRVARAFGVDEPSTVRNLTMVAALISELPLLLVARNDLAVATLPDFIAYARVHQAKMQYSSSGVGSTNHLACALSNSVVGINATR